MSIKTLDFSDKILHCILYLIAVNNAPVETLVALLLYFTLFLKQPTNKYYNLYSTKKSVTKHWISVTKNIQQLT